jgi:hypothetical protein
MPLTKPGIVTLCHKHHAQPCSAHLKAEASGEANISLARTQGSYP